MGETIASNQFESTLDYSALPKAKLLELYDLTVTAHRNFFHMWQQAVKDKFGEEACAEMTALVYPNLEAANDDLTQVFYEELNFLWLVMLWNVATLTYCMQTGRWTDLITERYDQDTALKLERSVWLDYGGSEEDLHYGLIAAGAETGNIETLFRGFQMAPGEVGLVDAEFDLKTPNHGVITHKRCPAHECFGETNRERLESSCVSSLCAFLVKW